MTRTGRPLHGWQVRVAALTAALTLVAMLVAVTRAEAVTLPTGFSESTIASGFDQPTASAWTPDGRLLVAEKSGRLKVARPPAAPTLALDISSVVNNYHDRGMLGLAVDSSFAANHYIYLLFTYELTPIAPDNGGQMVSQLRRYVLNDDNTVTGMTILLGSYTSGVCPAPSDTLDCIPSEGLSHSIGTVRSAPDGTLYVGSGDAASYSVVDPLALRTYDERSLAGKIMRIDRNGNGVTGHPFCPTNANLTQVCTKLYAKGFRNPFRFKLRPDASLSVADVGWNSREELDLIRTGGGNYGWPCYEGTARTSGYRDLAGCQAEYVKEGTPNADVAPQHDYAHTSGGNAIMSGPEYRGDQYPSGYLGSIFFGDYSAGFIRRATVDAGNRITSVANFATAFYGVDLDEAPDGNLTYIAFGSGTAGKVQRITYSTGNQAPVASFTATPTSGTAPLAVAFDGAASSDPDGDALTYSWAFGDGGTATGRTASRTYTTPGSYTARLTVSDGRGRTGTTSRTITVGSRPPEAVITAPAEGSTYRDGATVSFAGSATDPDEGPLGAARMTWNVVLRHGDHAHPMLTRTGIASGTFVTQTDHDADSSYEITLTATDSFGLTSSATRVIRPETTALTLASQPAGAALSYAGTDRTAPTTLTSAIGFTTSISAVASFTKDGRVWNFDRWSDGGARLHTITVPAAATTVTAIYADGGPAPVPGLVAAYAFDETTGPSAGDASGHAHTGAVTGASWTAAGRHGGALSFDGVDDWVTVADADDLDLRNAMTFSAWVRLSSLKAWQTVLLKEGAGTLAYGLYATNGGTGAQPNANVGDDAAYWSSRVALNTWYHLTATYDGATLRFYVDGTLIATRTHVPKPGATTGVLRIGGNTIWGGEQFHGLLDDVRLYDRALSAAEVAADMDAAVPGGTTTPPPPTTSGAVVDLRFDDGSGSTAADSSGRGHDGTVRSATWTPAGKLGGALRFNGLDSWVTVPDAADLDLTSTLSLEAWVRPDTLRSWQTVLAKEGTGQVAYGLWATGGAVAQPNGAIGDLAGWSPSAIATGRWTHLALVYTSSSMRLYVDGQLVDVRTGVTAPPATAGALRIGGNNVWSGEGFDGLIDEVKVWDRALTDAEVASHAAVGSATATIAAVTRTATTKRARAKVIARSACTFGLGAAARSKAAQAARKGHKVRTLSRCPGVKHRARVAKVKR